MHGTVAAVGALQKSDLILALGARFDDRVTGRLDTFAPDAVVVHADIDPAEISKNRVADVPIVGDAKEVIVELIACRARPSRRPDARVTTRHGATPSSGCAARIPSATRRPPTARWLRSTSSSGSAPSPARTRCTQPASVSTRCGRRSS